MYSIETCRICLQQKPEQSLKPTSSVNADDGVSFLQHLEYCVNEVNWSSDDFPSLLCDDCINDLLNASKFKLRCIETDIRRQQYIEKHAWKSNLNKAILFNSDRFEVIEEETVGNEDSKTNDKAKEEYNGEQSDLKKTTEVDLVVGSEKVKEELIGVEDYEIDENNCDIELKIDIEETKVVACNETNECIKKQEKTPVDIDKSKTFCSLCNLTISTKSLSRHLQTVHNFKKVPALPSYIDKDKCFCTLCNRTYSKKTLRLHVQKVHTLEKKYKCGICSEAFTTSMKLNKHKMKHSDKRECVCYVCGKTYKNLEQLKCHLESHENKRKYKCNLCEKSFNVRTTLQTHKKHVHTDRETWKHLCAQCGKKFASRTILNLHVKRRHLKLKEHACPLCHQKFVTKSEVELHRLRHSNVRLNKCEICGTEFKRKGALTRHVKNIHDIRTVKETIKKYTCDECPKKFSYRTDFERHKNSHSGLKPYSCSECDERFGCEKYVRRHLLKKHGKSKNCSG